MTAREQLATCTVDNLPTLDVAVLGALELCAETPLTPLQIDASPLLILGSGNAFMAAQILFSGRADCQFADESTYTTALSCGTHTAVVVVSASGGKHAVPMVEAALSRGLPTYLLTNSAVAPAAAALPSECVFTYPKNREPYTYNTSTYLTPLCAAEAADAEAITAYIKRHVTPLLLRNFEDYSAYTLLLPKQYIHVREMARTKFDELFGPMVTGRVFTGEEVKHAKTVVQSGEELFISFGVDNRYYGLMKNRLHIPLPADATYTAVIAIVYFVIGRIQAAQPPYFAQQIERYAETASKIFGQPISPIVE